MATGAGRFDSHSTTRPTCGVRHGKGSLHTNAACVALGTRKRVKRRLAFFLGAKRFCCRAFSIRRGQCCCIYGECRAARPFVPHLCGPLERVLHGPCESSHQPPARSQCCQAQQQPVAAVPTCCINDRRDCDATRTHPMRAFQHEQTGSFRLVFFFRNQAGKRQQRLSQHNSNDDDDNGPSANHRTNERTNHLSVCAPASCVRAFVRSFDSSFVRLVVNERKRERERERVSE